MYIFESDTLSVFEHLKYNCKMYIALQCILFQSGVVMCYIYLVILCRSLKKNSHKAKVNFLVNKIICRVLYQDYY